MKLNYSIGTLEEVELIHAYSLEVLRDVGAVFHSEDAIEIFRKHGFKVDGQTVYFKKQEVEDAIKSAPPHYTWYGNQTSVEIGKGGLKATPAYGPIYVHQNGEYKKSAHIDFVNFHKLNETSEVMDVSSCNTLDVSFVPVNKREEYRLGTTLKYCKKPIYGIVDGGYKKINYCLDKMKDFYGVTDDKVFSTGLLATMGAMQMSTDMCEALIAYSERKQAIIITSGTVLGANAPQSMAGSFVLGNAMILAGLVLSQLVNPGTPVIYCAKFSSSDIQRLAPAYGGIEAMLGCATSRAMASYYELPLQSGSSVTESKANDYQGGAETFSNLFSAYMLEVDCLLHACGVLDSMNSLSYEKYILDEEMNLTMKHLTEGYFINDESVMIDLIKKKGPTGSYLGRTMKMFLRDFYIPKYAVRDSHNEWVTKGKLVSEDLARQQIDKRLNAYKEIEHDQDQVRIIEELIPEF
ncbi:MAG: trimethylamine methyltransferase [Eubacteriaceae bacterium]|jgi:trimethylamine--corrinoid protein Co-methyltransferase|nr:trimethylamine methyltransferase [Eubacteriaceae bacterium]